MVECVLTKSNPPRPPSVPVGKPGVLVVDDEPQVLVALEDILSDEFVVRTTSSPQQALELASDAQDLAVVISDQRMPGMTGDELLGRLSEDSLAERILVTGFADLSAVVKAVNDGRIFAYITKPWDAHDLQQKVRRAAEHYRIARELAYERQLLHDLMQNIPDGIYFKDPELRFIRVNEAFARVLSKAAPNEFIGKRLAELSNPADASSVEGEERNIIRHGSRVIDRIREYGVATGTQWLSETKVPVRGPTGSPLGLVGISRDVTDRVQAENARELQQQRIARLTRIHKVLSGINSAIVRITDRDALLRAACQIAVEDGNLAFATIAARLPDSSFSIVAAMGSEEVQAPLLGTAGGSVEDGLELLRRVDGGRAPVLVNDTRGAGELGLGQQFASAGHEAIAAFPLAPSGELEYVFVLSAKLVGFFDSEEVRLLTELAGNLAFALGHAAAKAQLDFLAYYDELTGLPNQRLLQDRVMQQAMTSKGAHRKLALLILGVDRLRSINETFGRVGGDDVLKQVAERLQAHVTGQNSLARVEGNRFAILAPLVAEESSVASFAETLLSRVLDRTFRVGDTELSVSGRFGIALFPSDGDNAETLISNAEAALDRAKTLGQRSLFYTSSMNARVAEKLSLETRLRRALDNEEFVLHYQPKVELRRGQIVGVEALLRWQTPDKGLVPPGVFIPVLEETGLILDVGRWVLAQAAAQYAEWTRLAPRAPRVAVNVSALQLRHPDFLRSIDDTLAVDDSVSGMLELEITESVFVDDLEGSVWKLAGARERGFQVAIDDFGTGYSSLAYLSRLPIDTLKIDRSFIARMRQAPHDMALVTTVISMAHSLECKVVAEGVELAEQAQLLRLLRCDEIQGYLISRPLPPAEVCELFETSQQAKWIPAEA